MNILNLVLLDIPNCWPRKATEDEGLPPGAVCHIPWYKLPKMLHALPEKCPELGLIVVLPLRTDIDRYLSLHPHWKESVASKKYPFWQLDISEWPLYIESKLGYRVVKVITAELVGKSLVPNFGFTPCPFLSSAFSNNLITFAPNLKNLYALDVGCAAGRDMVYLSRLPKFNWHVTGIDSLSNVLESAMQLDELYLHKFTNEGKERIAPELQLINGVFRKDGSFRFKSHYNLPSWAENNPTCFGPKNEQVQRYNLVICVRTITRDTWGLLQQCIEPGGYFLSHTFSRDESGNYPFARPSGDDHLLKYKELSTNFTKEQGFDVLVDDIVSLKDGRFVNNFLCKKIH